LKKESVFAVHIFRGLLSFTSEQSGTHGRNQKGGGDVAV
jgi:hypothetical protein